MKGFHSPQLFLGKLGFLAVAAAGVAIYRLAVWLAG